MKNHELDFQDDAFEESGTQIETLPSDWPERIIALAENFLCTRRPQTLELKLLNSFLSLSLRFGFLEGQVQGEILCDIPAHLAVLKGARYSDLLEETEALAETERENLGLAPGPLEGLADCLDERGIKVIELAPATPTYCGAFVFEDDTGPAVLSMAPINTPSSRFIIAHQYCHMLTDVDPYHNRFCVHESDEVQGAGRLRGPTWGGRLLQTTELDPADETSLPELRADLFARNLLVPRTHFVNTLREFEQGKRGRYEIERLSHIAFYYGVPDAVIVHRLIDCELIEHERAAALVRELQDVWPQDRVEEPIGISATTVMNRDLSGPLPIGLPVRFVHLAIALFIQGRITPDQIETVLDVDTEMVTELMAWVEHSRLEAERMKKEAKLPDLAPDPENEADEVSPRD